MSFQSSLEAIRFLLMSECEWQRIPCSGTMVGKRTLTIEDFSMTLGVLRIQVSEEERKDLAGGVNTVLSVL